MNWWPLEKIGQKVIQVQTSWHEVLSLEQSQHIHHNYEYN